MNIFMNLIQGSTCIQKIKPYEGGKVGRESELAQSIIHAFLYIQHVQLKTKGYICHKNIKHKCTKLQEQNIINDGIKHKRSD